MSTLPPHDHAPAQRAMLGLRIFLVSLSIFFVGLFILYGWLRADMASWPPPGQPSLPLLLPTLNTVVVLASSATIHLAVHALRHARPQRFGRLVLVTANLGALFLVLQGLLFRQALELGIEVGSTLYAGLMYALAGVHALHFLVGVVAVVALSLLAWRRTPVPSELTRVRMWGAYWHFLSAVWIGIYVLVFIL